MSENMNFRSAFNGFNREDVVHYIEYLNANHENQVKQLQADLAAIQKECLLSEPAAQSVVPADLQEQFNQQEAILTALNAEKDELVLKCAQQEAELNRLRVRNQELTEAAARESVSSVSSVAENQQLAERVQQQDAVAAALRAENKALQDKIAQLQTALTIANAEKSTALTSKSQLTSCAEEELAAYRRAERVEREATERANVIYRKLRSTLNEAATHTNNAVSSLDGVVARVNTQLNDLQSALTSSKTYLDQSLASIHEIRPGKNEE